jgi:hypothetical protein
MTWQVNGVSLLRRAIVPTTRTGIEVFILDTTHHKNEIEVPFLRLLSSTSMLHSRKLSLLSRAGLYDNREQREKRKAEQLKKETARRKALWEAFQKQNGTRMSRSASYRASRSKKGTWRGWDSLSSNEPSTDMHRMARMKQEEERAREIVEQALMDNGLPFSLDEILDA